MNTLVTGGAGFVGSHLCDELLRRGHRVLAIDDFSTGAALNLIGVLEHPRFEFVRGSILDRDLIGELIGSADRVFHLAAAVGVHTIVDDPLRSLRTNLQGTETVVSAALEHDCRILITSTSEIYGKNSADKLGEDADRILGSPLKSRWSYAEAKALDEMVAHTCWQKHGLRVVIARLFNTVGPRQSGRYGMVLPRLVQQALEGQPLTVYGNGQQTRCFCHVYDVVPALIDLLEEPKAYGRAVNLGGAKETSIEELAELIRHLTGSTSSIRRVPYEEAYGPGFEDMQRRVPDLDLARQLIGFAPRHDLHDMVRSVISDITSRQQLHDKGWLNGQPTNSARTRRLVGPRS